MGRKSRSTYVVDEAFEDVNATSLEEVFEQQAKNIDGAIEEIEKLIDKLEDAALEGEFTGTRSEIEDAIFRRAFLETVDVIEDKALNFLVTAAIEATVKTGEFNYPAYQNHLLGAMQANIEKLIVITPYVGRKEIRVRVNLDILGKPEEWGTAVKKYREDKGIGKLSKEDKKVGSKVWREKIYGVGREGGKIKRYYKRDQVTLDVTDKYKNKYKETVEGRLALLPDNKAPFWYLIEHGNIQAGDKLKLDTDGIAYPSFGKTDFGRNSEEAIAKAFLQVWTEYERAAREVVENLEDERVRELREQTLEKIEAGEITVGKNKLADYIQIDEGRLEAYESGIVRLRDPKTGYYAKVPMGR